MSARGTRIATYTDGTRVQEGDAIRFKQAPGGLLAPSAEWAYGIAAKHPHTDPRDEDLLDADELYLYDADQLRYSYIVGHIVERDTTNKED